MAEPKKLGKIRSGQVAASRSPVLGGDDLPFWVDDRVRQRKPGDVSMRLAGIPGYPADVRLVREILCGEDASEAVFLLSDHLFGGWQEAASAEGVELVERGNVWRLDRGEPTIFRDWREELDCRWLCGLSGRVHHPGGKSVRWHPDEAEVFIKNGAADAYAAYYPSRPPAGIPEIRLYRFEDREAGRRVAAQALVSLEALVTASSPKQI